MRFGVHAGLDEEVLEEGVAADETHRGSAGSSLAICGATEPGPEKRNS